MLIIASITNPDDDCSFITTNTAGKNAGRSSAAAQAIAQTKRVYVLLTDHANGLTLTVDGFATSDGEYTPVGGAT